MIGVLLRTALLAVLACACGVPVSSSAPFATPPTAAGSSGLGAALEHAPLDAIATVAKPPDASAPHRYPTTDSPAWRLQFSHGLREQLQLHIGAEGGLYAVVPVPHSGYWGVSSLIHQAASLDVGISARLGYGGFLAEGSETETEGSRAQVVFAGVTGDVTFRRGKRFRPGAALTVQPMWIRPDVVDQEAGDLYGAAISLTLRAALGWVSPFATGTVHTSNNVRGTGPSLSFGLAVQH